MNVIRRSQLPRDLGEAMYLNEFAEPEGARAPHDVGSRTRDIRERRSLGQGGSKDLHRHWRLMFVMHMPESYCDAASTPTSTSSDATQLAVHTYDGSLGSTWHHYPLAKLDTCRRRPS
ncbi:hypothetical protein PISMIDRAFT_689325 [Pisolithus microcarpus 441]|uniref:Uncharacterized protein n=1 Tax=Pisolithus microcarpus 441 TaxID=765257 RepID=A0A0C9YQJ4_9AGAM|nr:hypothetical protein BKA83DRAFT_689325 [Pisolithus microcarpus]KIK12632.1 hypothetical protein PISMIDRAFT_689325 [Pisolithus microcarpus 441]